MITPEPKTYGDKGLQYEYQRSKRTTLPFVSDIWKKNEEQVQMEEEDIQKTKQESVK